MEVSLTERDLTPGRVEVEDGESEFIVKHDGDRSHTFAVETPDGSERTDPIEPGEEARLEVTLPDGRYRMYDPRGGYRARGVRGLVVVNPNETDTVTERTVERTVEEEPEEPQEPEEPPVTVTERDTPPPRRTRPPRPQPAPAPPPTPTVTEQVPVEPPPENP